MERQLFDWSGWDGETDCMIFYDPVLKVQIGEHPVGTKFSSAAIVQKPEEGKGVLQLWKDDENYDEYELHYRVGQKL